MNILYRDCFLYFTFLFHTYKIRALRSGVESLNRRAPDYPAIGFRLRVAPNISGASPYQAPILMAGIQSILVLGAGELGLAVLQGLTQHAQRNTNTITVLLRLATIVSSDEKKQAQISSIQELGVGILAGDVTMDPAVELAQLFKPFTTIISCTGMTGSKGTQVKIANAVIDSGCQRYIPWQFGVDYDAIGRGSAQDLFSEQLDVRDLLRSQTNTTWVIISTGTFMTFLFEGVFGVVNSDRTVVRALGRWDNRVTVITVEDVGRLTAEVVFAASKIKNEVVFIAGETVSYVRVAEVVEQTLERRVEKAEWDLNALREDLKQNPDDPIKKYRIVFAEGTGVAWDKESTLNWKKGIKMTDIDQWARANLK